uniref:DNA 5'-3' helicase n=1 Tax=viral metagenome TaxID=1070528 RepID=A0A6M3LPR1_9ZZZZ
MLLGQCFLDPTLITKITLTPEEMFRDYHKNLLKTLRWLYEKDGAQGINPLSIAERLKPLNKLDEVGGFEHLLDLSSVASTTANAEHFQKLIRETYQQRKCIALAQQIEDAAYKGSPIIDILELADKGLFEIRKGKDSRGGEIGVVLRELTKQITINQEPRFYPTGLCGIDGLIGGLEPGTYNILGGFTSSGKTALGLTMLIHFAREGLHIHYLSWEMGRLALVSRLITMVGQIPTMVMRSNFQNVGDEQAKKYHKAFIKACGEISSWPMYLYDTRGYNIEEARGLLLSDNAKRKIDVVFVDYLQLIRRSGSVDREEGVGNISHALQVLAAELDAVVIAMAQLNREAAKEKRPRIHHLRESGRIEQDGDMVMLVHIPEANGVMQDDNASVFVEKNRVTGALGQVPVKFVRDYAHFADRYGA